MAAAAAASVELALEWRTSPIATWRFVRSWLGVAVLDAMFAGLALVIVYRVSDLRRYGWLDEPVGWFLIGVSASLAVRGNLAKVGLGPITVGLGLGFAYVALRSPFDQRLFDESHRFRRARDDAVFEIFAERIASASGFAAAFRRLGERYLDYLRARIDSTNRLIRLPSSALIEAQEDIELADQNVSNRAKVLQLTRSMIQRGMLLPLEQCFGQLSRSEVRSRARQALQSPK